MNRFGSALNTLKPTCRRPLQGLMVLLVKDSLSAGEVVRLMCVASGARIRRANYLGNAWRHLRVYRPDVAIIDMELPDGNGCTLIEKLSQASPRTPTITGLSADPNQTSAAIDLVADSFVEKPLNSPARFQSAILVHLPENQHSMDIIRLPEAFIEAGQSALQKDLAHAVNLFDEGENSHNTHAYLATFVTGVPERRQVTPRRGWLHCSDTEVKSELQAMLTDRLAEKLAG